MQLGKALLVSRRNNIWLKVGDIEYEDSGFRNRLLFFHCVFWIRGKKKEKSEVATKVSFVALSESFFDRLDIFSDARLLKITLVLLFFDENLLPTVSSGLAWPGAHTAAFQFCTHRSVSDAKSDPQASGRENLTWLQSCCLSRSVNRFGIGWMQFPSRGA